MASEAAKQVKFGFLVAAGFWAFGIVMCIILLISLKALGSK